MKDSFRRIRLTIRKCKPTVVLCVLLCLACLARSQNGEFLPGQSKSKTSSPKMQRVVSPQVLTQAVVEPRIPQLVGHTLFEVGRIVGSQFTVAIIGHKSTVPQDVVIRQYPPVGTPAKTGAEIAVWLSEPASSTTTQPLPLVQVPNLVGHTRDSAIQILILTHFPQGDITVENSEDSDGVVVSQHPIPRTMVPPNTRVSFVVSEKIQRILTLTGPISGMPGENLRFVAHLDPYFPSTQYQFTFGDGESSALAPNAEITHPYSVDGNYEVRAFAIWDGGKASSDSFPVTVHSINYSLTLTFSPTQPTEGHPIEFHAELDRPIQNAVYTFDFGDRTKPESLMVPFVRHVYRQPGPYTARVSVLEPDHKHRIPSPPTQVVILASPLSPGKVVGDWLNQSKSWIIGGVVLLMGGFLLGTLRSGPRKANRRLPSPNIELKPSIPPGRLTVRVQGRLWSRIESLRAENNRDHTS